MCKACSETTVLKKKNEMAKANIFHLSVVTQLQSCGKVKLSYCVSEQWEVMCKEDRAE